MLEVFAYIVPTVLVTLIGAYLYVEAQKRKAIKAKKRAIINHVSALKSNFKLALDGHVEQHLLSIKQHQAIYRIANNFFIFQPVTSKSIEFCEFSLNNVISAMPSGGPESIHFESIQEQINVFVRALPVAPNGYNSNFYRNDLPLFIKKVNGCGRRDI